MTEDTQMMRSEELAGSIAKRLLKELQSMRHGWKQTPQGEQEAYIDHCEDIAVELVSDVLDIMTGDGVSEFTVTIHKTATNQETVEAKISVSREDPNALDLHKLAYSPATLFASVKRDQYLNTGKRAKSDPDQPTMFDEDDKDDDGDGEPAVQELERPQPSPVALVKTSGGPRAKKPTKPTTSSSRGAAKSSSRKGRGSAASRSGTKQLAELA